MLLQFIILCNSIGMKRKTTLIIGFDIELSNSIFESCNEKFGKSEIINNFLHKYNSSEQFFDVIIYAITEFRSYRDYIASLRLLYRKQKLDFDFDEVIVVLRTEEIRNSCKVFLNRLIKSNHEKVYIAKYVADCRLGRDETPRFHCWTILGDSKILPERSLYVPMKIPFKRKTFDVIDFLTSVLT